jgi:argininosuccinate synthase
MKTKVILAYSGGLDTSFCIPYLTREKGMEVHTVLVNTGGFTAAEIIRLEEKDKVVTGPYSAISRTLENGTKVEPKTEAEYSETNPVD